MIEVLFLALVVLGYGAGSLGLVLDALGRQRPGVMISLIAGALGGLAHAGLLFLPALLGAAQGTHFFRSLSLVAWAMALVLTLGVAGSRARVLLVAIWPVALLAALLGALAPDTRASEALGWQIRLHVIVALSAYALLGIAALHAIVVAWQEHSLRRKRFGGLMRALPPLSAMESLLFQYIVAGFALLTLTVLSGALFIEDWMAQHLVHKTVLTLLAWGVFGTLVFGHWRYGWRGRIAVRWTLSGMAALLLAFFGSKFVLEIILGRSLG